MALEVTLGQYATTHRFLFKPSFELIEDIGRECFRRASAMAVKSRWPHGLSEECLVQFMLDLK